jgi:hypothetical protein
VDGGAHLVFGLIDKIPDGVDELTVAMVVAVGGWIYLSVAEFSDVAIVVFFGDEVELVLFNQFVGDYVGQEPATVGIDV